MKTSRVATINQYLLLVIISTFLQGSSFVSTKIVMSDVPPLWTASARFFVAALTLCPFVFLLMRRQQLKLRDLPWVQLFLIGSLQTTGVMAFLNFGLLSTSPSTAAILMASNPLLVVPLAWIFLGERSSMLALVGLLIAFIGVIICIGISHSGNGINYGDGLVMLASGCWACSTVLNKKFDFTLSPWIVTFWQMLLGALVLAIVAIVSKQHPALPSTPYKWGMFFWLAIPASTGAMGLWFAALKIGGSVQTSGFLFLCPLFAALIAFALTRQTPALHEVIGGVLIGVGLYIMSRWRYASEEEGAKQKKALEEIND
ncbi:EamA/RhaT family transporter [Prodigiosinella confusarubida]|uniref:EamA/RhaT family transporter n=1 Tax=Serratia sp. (strain ATCC 39006) TaxID=104623 RepID=A0A2I5TEQ9_SERS3|nr:DMT family transporter [Serratia sp. ATCC 39006]AUG98711.1 EamA/RhaT family transporter [Serratia sp. ATCC 39006]AUH03026.1 EamA/RhaT family transporter [Serratia sp. ATCC 39006]